MAKKIICMLTVLSIVFSSLPILTVTAEEAVKTATQITSAEQLVDGQYVIVTETNFAMTVFDSTWVLSKAVTPVDGKLTDVTSDMIWDVTTDGASATLTDSNGASIAPKGGNNNGIKSGEYSWSIIFNDGMFQFAGVDADTVRLSANVSSDSKFRAYKNTTIDKSPNGYIANFYIFAIDEEGGSDTPDVPDVPDVPETNEYGTAVSTGSCGAEAVWTLYDSGTLVISGKGQMTDYILNGGTYSTDAPWFNDRASVKSIIVESGITTVGANAFYACSNATSAVIPEGIASIGDGAFEYCNLASFTAHEGVMSIGDYAFVSNNNLTTVNLPATLESVGEWAFDDCTSLSKVIYAGAKSEWKKIAIGDNNAPLLNAEIVYLTVEAEGIEISSLPSKLEYAYGESLSLDGIVVKVYFSDGTVAETTEYTVSEFNKYSYGKQTLTVFYGELFAEFSVTVKAQNAPVSDSTVALGMTVGELKAAYGEKTVYVLSSDGKTVLSDSDVVKTGSVVQVVQDGAVVDSAALVVESDVDGDGRLTSKDFIRLKKQIAQGSWVEYPEYADINRDGVVDTLDLEALALAIA